MDRLGRLVVIAPARRAGDSGSNPGSGENFSLKLLIYVDTLKKSFSLICIQETHTHTHTHTHIYIYICIYIRTRKPTYMHTIHTFHTYTIHINIYTYHTYTLHIYTLYIQHNAYIYTHVIYIKKEELYFKAYTEKQWPVTTNKLTLVSKHLKRYIYSMDFEKLQGE